MRAWAQALPQRREPGRVPVVVVANKIDLAPLLQLASGKRSWH